MTKREFEIPGFSQLSGAVFSPCCCYRYLLWRRWPSGLYGRSFFRKFAAINEMLREGEKK